MKIPSQGQILAPHPHKGSKEPVMRKYEIQHSRHCPDRAFVQSSETGWYPKSFAWLRKWIKYTIEHHETQHDQRQHPGNP